MKGRENNNARGERQEQNFVLITESGRLQHDLTRLLIVTVLHLRAANGFELLKTTEMRKRTFFKKFQIEEC